MAALERMGESAVPALAVALGSNNAMTRQNAATTLGYIGSPRATSSLQLTIVDSDPIVRSEAIWALDQIQSTKS
jgi:HEAT repeat protein